ncbi:MAG: hypothetical protein ACRDAU_09145 [Clostridium sp.]
MKKKVIIVIVIVIVIIFIIGGVFWYSNSKNTESTKVDNKPKVTQTTQKNSDTTKTQEKNNATKNVKADEVSTQKSNNGSNQNTSEVSNTANTSNSQNMSQAKESNNSNSGENTSSGSVKLISYNVNTDLSPSNIMVENTTGQVIPDNILIQAIKSWILTYQYQYSGFADWNGTMWSEQWLNNIPDSDLINYFIQANGQSALTENITAEELYKTAGKTLQFAEEHPVPFPLNVAKQYITQMMIKDEGRTPDKIVFHGNATQGGDYYVYVKGDSNPYWYVESPIGYGTGV